jgi:isopentenyl-diphosphate delta-isomerase
MTGIATRKLEHLDLCARADVESRRTTLLEEVELVHEALPELGLDEIDPSVRLLGRSLRAPIVISGMTGGAERAGRINRALAAAAQELGLAMGLGSQRAMLRDPGAASTYAIRDVAPDVLLLANLGCVQARDTPTSQVAELVDAVSADALCLHLNVAQELAQDEGDRDFRGCVEAIARLVEELPVPVVVKETGCGLSARTLSLLHEIGVELVDVAGVGGTTWPGVESLRGSPRQRAMGAALREWGIPTAASLVYAERTGLAAIASGGVRDAHDVVRALALGASAAGLALPFLLAHERGGRAGVVAFGRELVETLRGLMLLVGARGVADLRRLPVLLGPTLQAWTSKELQGPPAAARGPVATGEPVSLHVRPGWRSERRGPISG